MRHSSEAQPDQASTSLPQSTTSTLLGAMAGAPPSLPSWQSKLILQLIESLKKNYVFPEKINEAELHANLAKEFRQHFSTAEYHSEESIVDKKKFSEKVTQILQELIEDPHLALLFNPEGIKENKACVEKYRKFPWALPHDSPEYMSAETKEKLRQSLEENKSGFYGIEELETSIPENVGYMGLRFMADAEMFEIVKMQAFQTMQSLQDKEAIIIDLRGNTGGSPEAVQYYLSFFFSDPTHLNTAKIRVDGEWQEKRYVTLARDQLNPGGVFEGQPVPDLSEKPVYILVDGETFSAGEELAYDMQQLERGTIIGSQTAGGAHPCRAEPLIDPSDDSSQLTLNENFMLFVPYATSINPISKTNWEKGPLKGVQPDLQVDASEELKRALDEIQLRGQTSKNTLPTLS